MTRKRHSSMFPDWRRPVCRRPPESGSAIVEAALTLTLTLLLLVVVFELGVTALIYQGVSERARDGVRYASVHPNETTKIQNVVVYGNPEGTGSALLGLDLSRVTVSAEALDNESDIIAIEVEIQPYPLITRVLNHGVSPITVRVDIPVEDSSYVP